MTTTGVALWPAQVAMIGGGRWARVLTEVLCQVVPPSVGISVHSEHNAAAMSAWAKSRGLSERLHISPSWPTPPLGAVIIANATHDHERAAARALTAGAPVLIEKPMAVTSAGAQRLIELANGGSTRLAAAHVLRFATYLDRFATCVGRAGPIRSIRIEWCDPRHEKRYGEPKQFDASVPVVVDVLPHVVSLISTLTADPTSECTHLEVSHGGAQVEFDLLVGSISCRVELARNSERRQRVIEVNAGVERPEVFRLDFSTEPGIITHHGETQVADTAWHDSPRPVARMLTAFLQWAAGGAADRRLDVELGLRACAMSDQAVAAYHAALLPWVGASLVSASHLDEDLRYALTEILHTVTSKSTLEKHAHI